MKRGEIIRKILKDIASRIYVNERAGELDYILEDIDEDILDVLENWTSPENISHLQKGMKDVVAGIRKRIQDATDRDFLDKDVEECPKFFAYDESDELHCNYIKPLVTNESPFVVSTLIFWKDTWIVDFSEDNRAWSALLRIWQKLDDCDKFWESLRTRNHKYRQWIAIKDIDEPLEGDKPWRVYSYAYLQWVNTNRFDIPKDLVYEPQKLFRTYQYKDNVLYEHFLDVYDVLNEVKHSKDVLTTYLKVYQVIEQMAYRMKLNSVIESAADSKCSFVRELEALTDGFKSSERDTVVSCIMELFPTLADSLNAEIGNDKILNANCRKFLGKRYNVAVDDKGKYTINSAASLVYSIRNSIVHNKETEYHLMYNNVNDYKDIIELIKLLIAKLMEGIMRNIEMPFGTNKIVYKRNEIRFF